MINHLIDLIKQNLYKVYTGRNYDNLNTHLHGIYLNYDYRNNDDLTINWCRMWVRGDFEFILKDYVISINRHGDNKIRLIIYSFIGTHTIAYEIIFVKATLHKFTKYQQ